MGLLTCMRDLFADPTRVTPPRSALLGSAIILLLAGGCGTEDVVAVGPISSDDVTPILMKRISVPDVGGESNGDSDQLAISNNGRMVVFHSNATNLNTRDSNQVTDIYLRDQALSSTVRISQTPSGRQPEAPSIQPAISGDGQVIVFASTSAALEVGDVNGVSDIFFSTRILNVFGRANVLTSNDVTVGQANGSSFWPDINDDGTVIVFESDATNLATDTNGFTDIFAVTLQPLRGVVDPLIQIVSRSTAGNQVRGNSTHAKLNSAGDFVIFLSTADDTTVGETNGTTDLYMREITPPGPPNNTTVRLSVATDGTEADADVSEPYFSGNGLYAVYTTVATTLDPGDTNGLADVYVRDIAGNRTIRASLGNFNAEPNGPSRNGAITEDGRFVSFISAADNLVSGDNNGSEDLFIRDLIGGVTTRVSEPLNGDIANGSVLSGQISPDGTRVVFSTTSTNMNVLEDNNNSTDIFTRSIP